MARAGQRARNDDGGLEDRISVGVLAKVFPRALVEEVIDAAGAREQRKRMLPAWLTLYFVLACATRRELFRVEVEDLRRRVVAAT